MGVVFGTFWGIFGCFFGGDMEVLWHLYHLKKVTRHASGEVSRIAKFFRKLDQGTRLMPCPLMQVLGGNGVPVS